MENKWICSVILKAAFGLPSEEESRRVLRIDRGFGGAVAGTFALAAERYSGLDVGVSIGGRVVFVVGLRRYGVHGGVDGYTYDDLAECSKWLPVLLKSARIAEEIQQQGAAGFRWYSKLHANEKYREVIDGVTDRDRRMMQRPRERVWISSHERSRDLG